MLHDLDPSAFLFTPSSIDESITSTELVESRPLSAIKTGHPVFFEIASSNDMFVDPDIYMKMSFKIVNADGTSIGADIPVAL